MSEEQERKENIENIEKIFGESNEEVAVAAQAEELSEVEEFAQRVCKQCGNPEIEEGYLTDLCKNCRDELSRIHLPIWVKGFAALVAILLVFALINFPSTLGAGIAYEKGNRFEQEKRYMSAMREYEKVVNVYPNSTEPLCKLFIAQFKVGRLGQAVETFDKVNGKNLDNEQLYSEVTNAINQLDTWYYPTEEYQALLNTVKDMNMEEARDEIAEYVNKNPNDLYPKMQLASIYDDIGELDKAKSIAVDILEDNPDFVDCSFMLGAFYRESKEYDKAIELYNKILEGNVERADAISAIARIEIKKGNDEAGLDMAQKAFNIDNTDPYIISNLVLAYHYNNLKTDRDKAFELFKKQKNVNSNDMDLLTGIINGTNTEWREN